MRSICFIKRAFDVVFTIMIVGVIIAVVLITDCVINNQTPSLFGYTIYRIQSTSMEPKLMENSVILSKIIDNEKEIQKGDIVTIKREGEKDSITHAVIKAPFEKNGKLMIQTQGISNSSPDPPVYTKYVESRYVKTLSFFDTVYKVLLSPYSIFLFLFLILYMVFDEIFFRYKAKSA